jgi:hypothetical protein
MPARHLTRLALALLVAASVTAAPTNIHRALAAAYGPSTLVLSEFDSSADWHLDTGTATLTTVSSPHTSGTGALRVDYNLATDGSVGIRPAGTPAELPGLPRRLSLDVFGDGSWNVVYFEVHDETGEILRYWVGNLSFTGWQTMSVDLGSTVPVSGLSGNQDKLLDLPGSFYQLVLYRNPGATKLASTIYVDDLVYQYDPSGVSIDTPIFVPSAGGSSNVHVNLSDQGTFALRFLDNAEQSKTWNGVAGGGQSWSAPWDGRDDSGNLMSGSVRAVISITRDNSTASYVYPYFAGLPARLPGSSPSQRGINSYVSAIDTQDRGSAEAEASQMEAAYVGMAREEFEWKRVEPTPGYFDWAKFDQAVEIEQAHGISILGKLAYGVAWDSTAPAGTSADAAANYPPADISAFVTYAQAVVHRYKGSVHVWEIWNEENSAAYWMPAPNAAAYTQLLKATYAAIKAEDPTATVVLGGLSTGPDPAFLKGIKDNGGWGSFDVLAIHTYVSGPPDGSMMQTWIDSAKSLVASYGAKPIWITEFGWSSYGSTTTSDQSFYLERSYEIASTAGVAGIFWFELANRGTNTSDPAQNYGVLNQDLTAKPAFAGLKCEDQALYAGTLPTCTSPVYPDSTFTGLTPTRILDTRSGLGLSGPFVSGQPRTFQVSGNLGGALGTLVPSDADAVVGNLTVTGATAGGYVYLGPSPRSSPTSSTINFPAKDNRANGVTVPLASGGTLSAVYKASAGAKAQVLFDVTGYYEPGTNGQYFVSVSPVRLLDSRSGNGVPGPFLSRVPQTFSVVGRTDSQGNVVVPADATAVTGNLTITGQTVGGYAYIGNVSSAYPSSSSVNAPYKDNRANNVTVALDSNGSLSAVFVGSTGSRADLIFDLTGYYTKAGGWTYVPATPTRLLDSRAGNGLSGKFATNTPRSFLVRGRGPIPASAAAVTGNLTVTNQTAKGYGFMADSAPAYPASSTINFPKGDNRANGVTLALSAAGTLDIVYVATSGATTDFIFDVTGYFH